MRIVRSAYAVLYLFAISIGCRKMNVLSPMTILSPPLSLVRLMDSTLVQESSITAAEIDQPKVPDVLDVDERMPSRNIRSIQNDGVAVGSTNRTITLQ